MYEILSKRIVEEITIRFIVECENPDIADAIELLTAQDFPTEAQGFDYVGHEWNNCWWKVAGSSSYRAEISCLFQREIQGGQRCQ